MSTRQMTVLALLASRSSSRLVRRCLPIHDTVRSMTLRRVGRDGEDMTRVRRGCGGVQAHLRVV